MWLTDHITPAHEHFISNLIRQKLLAEIHAIATPNLSKGLWALYLPEQESHEIGLLFAYYILKSNGINVFYLGQNVPAKSVKLVLDEIECTHTLSIWTTPFTYDEIKPYEEVALSKGVKFIFSTHIENTQVNSKSVKISSPKELMNIIN